MFTSDPSSALTVAHRRGHELRFAAASERLSATRSRSRRLAASLCGIAHPPHRTPLARTPARLT